MPVFFADLDVSAVGVNIESLSDIPVVESLYLRALVVFGILVMSKKNKRPSEVLYVATISVVIRIVDSTSSCRA